MAHSTKTTGDDQSGFCALCGIDTAGQLAWETAGGGKLYCGSCVEQLRQRPTLQTPLVLCDQCHCAWHLKSLARFDSKLLCTDCANQAKIQRAGVHVERPNALDDLAKEASRIPASENTIDFSQDFPPLRRNLLLSSNPKPPASDSEDSNILELIYTSAPHGLRPGSSGFCTVAMTRGMSAELVARLESLSSCDPVGGADAHRSNARSIVMAHWRVPIAGRTRSVLSRIAFGGLDYTQRPNKLAYHAVLPPAQQPIGGPASAFTSDGWMTESWSGSPCYLLPGKTWPAGDSCASPCAAWEAAAGDAGWGGMLAQTALADPSKISYLIHDPGFDPIPLIQEALALLPLQTQWQLTFATHFSAVPAGLNCAWRCVVAGSRAADKAAAHAATGLVIDLTKNTPPPSECDAVRCARAGTKLTSPPMLRGSPRLHGSP